MDFEQPIRLTEDLRLRIALGRFLAVVILLAGITAALLDGTPSRSGLRVEGPTSVSATTATSTRVETTTSTAPAETTTPPPTSDGTDDGAGSKVKRQPQTGGSSGVPPGRPPQPVGDLGSSSATVDGVTLELAVSATTDPGGIRVSMNIYADTGWFRDAHVDYGDGTFDPPESFTGCLYAKSPESSSPYYGIGMGWTHTYAQPGNYHVYASETITHQCPPDGSADRTVATSVDISVATGGEGSNGPVLPSVILRLDHDASDPSRGLVVPVAEDDDGWIGQLSLDWGDGSAPVVLVNPATCTDNGGAAYPVGYFSPGWQEHHYATGGSYTITVSIVSTGCQETDPQPATGTIIWTFA